MILRLGERRRGARGSRGESVVETLAAVLVCTFAILMLYSALAASSRMNAEADARLEQARADMTAADAQQGTGEYAEVEVEGFDETYLVEYYESDSGEYATYRLA